jgi:predicted DNA-binding protein YlxM (UPF0122 family)
MSSNLPALRDTDPKLILQRYLSDETTKEIAASYGVTRQALGQYLLKVAESEWKEAQVARALARKESAEDDLEDAEKTPDMLSLSRARERLKAAQWDLERVCRRIYGQDAPPQGVNAVQININLKRVGSEPRAVLSGEVDTNT